MRCGNDEAQYFGSYYSYTYQKEIRYCRACILFGRITEYTPVRYIAINNRRLKKNSFEVHIPTLTEVQQKCEQELLDVIKQGSKKIDLIAVTGAGKTEIVLSMIVPFLRNGCRIAFVCPRIDVIRELFDRIEHYFPEYLIIGWHQGVKTPRLGHIYVMTMHQMIHYQDFFDLIIIDEADAFPFFGQGEALMLKRFVERALSCEGVQIYMTATPKVEHGTPVYLMTKYNQRQLPTPQFYHVPLLKKRIEYGLWIKRFERLKEKQWLIFVPSITLGEEVVHYFEGCLSDRVVALAHGRLKTRDERIVAFRQKEIDILVTTSILERGVTFDDISVAILFLEHPLFSREMILQICGRVDRAAIEKPYYLDVYYEQYTDKIYTIRKQLKEMNARGIQALSDMP